MDKAARFQADCVTLATTQQVYATNLKALGVIDEVIPEEPGEDFESFPQLAARLGSIQHTLQATAAATNCASEFTKLLSVSLGFRS